MKTQNNTPSVVSNSPMPATMVPGGFTLGLELGDRSHHVCVLDAAGQIVREGALPNTRSTRKLEPDVEKFKGLAAATR